MVWIILIAVTIWGLIQIDNFLLSDTTAEATPSVAPAPNANPCPDKCQDAGIRRRLIKKYTPAGQYAIPSYIVQCESHGDPKAVNSSSGAGGAYQIMPSTWASYVTRIQHKIRSKLAEIGSRIKGLAQDTDLVGQHVVALLIWKDVGASAWSCA